MHTKAFDSWRWPYLDTKISRESVNLATHPVQFSEGKKGEVWPSLATSAKAYGEIRRKFIGGQVEWTEVRNVPLWHCNVFQSDGGETCRNITLVRQGILHVRDLMLDGAVHKEGIQLLAPSWQKLYKAKIKWLLKQQRKSTQAVELQGAPPPTARGVEAEDSGNSSSYNERAGSEADKGGVEGPGEGETAEQSEGGHETDTLEETAGGEMDGEHRKGGHQQVPTMLKGGRQQTQGQAMPIPGGTNTADQGSIPPNQRQAGS